MACDLFGVQRLDFELLRVSGSELRDCGLDIEAAVPWNLLTKKLICSNVLAWIFQLGMSKERERYYLFAGMGGSASRRKHKRILRWSIAAGLCVSGIVAGLLYFISEHRW